MEGMTMAESGARQEQATSDDLVNLSEDLQAWYWCQIFRCSKETIQNAITRVGPRVEDLRRELG
jgi:hypothetical protein